MKKQFILIAFATLISCFGFAQKNNKQLMSLKAEGNDKLKVRMFTDHKSVKAGQEFKIGFFFDLAPNWHTFGTEENGSNMPTQLELKLPKGFKVIKAHWPEKDLVQSKHGGFEEYYEKDFYVVYTIKAEKEVSGEQTFKAELNWQCCDPNMCILGDAKLETKVLIGKKKKNNLYKLIN